MDFHHFRDQDSKCTIVRIRAAALPPFRYTASEDLQSSRGCKPRNYRRSRRSCGGVGGLSEGELERHPLIQFEMGIFGPGILI